MDTELTGSTIHSASLFSVPGAKVGGDVLIAIVKLSERISLRRHYPFRSAVQLSKANSSTGVMLAASLGDARPCVVLLSNMKRW